MIANEYLLKNEVLTMIEIKDTKNILKSSNIILICLIVFLCSYLYITDPIITGDGHEYLGMTASFFNHLSPDLQEKDIELRNYVENENGINFTSDYNYNGYYKSISGSYYSWHFWIYPLEAVLKFK